MIHRATYGSDMLILVAGVDSFQQPLEPVLRMGDIVRLNSGGPRMMVIDVDEDGAITAAWRDSNQQCHEVSFPRMCVHRVSPL